MSTHRLYHSSLILIALSGCFQTQLCSAQSNSQNKVVEHLAKEETADRTLSVRLCKDFDLTGNGTNHEWDSTEWTGLTQLDKGGLGYKSEFKILYSITGIYLLFHGEDSKITTKAYEDFENIFEGDVFEVFFHPDPQVPIYFEYEVNQLDRELILTLSRLEGKSFSWIPWHHEPKHAGSIRKIVDVVGGDKEVNGLIQSWSAEIFFPYTALGLLPNVPPKPGTYWNANFCRLDYDSGNMIKWSWTPTIETSFHELEKFRSIRFE